MTSVQPIRFVSEDGTVLIESVALKSYHNTYHPTADEFIVVKDIHEAHVIIHKWFEQAQKIAACRLDTTVSRVSNMSVMSLLTAIYELVPECRPCVKTIARAIGDTGSTKIPPEWRPDFDEHMNSISLNNASIMRQQALAAIKKLSRGEKVDVIMTTTGLRNEATREARDAIIDIATVSAKVSYYNDVREAATDLLVSI